MARLHPASCTCYLCVVFPMGARDRRSPVRRAGALKKGKKRKVKKPTRPKVLTMGKDLSDPPLVSNALRSIREEAKKKITKMMTDAITGEVAKTSKLIRGKKVKEPEPLPNKRAPRAREGEEV